MNGSYLWLLMDLLRHIEQGAVVAAVLALSGLALLVGDMGWRLTRTRIRRGGNRRMQLFPG